jgi:hypothetical protein
METLELARTIFGSVGKVEHYVSPLVDLKILTPDTVEYGGQEMGLTSFGQRSLCKLLEIPNNFSTRLHADSESLWSEMTRRIEDLREQEIRVSTVVSESGKLLVEAINPSTLGWISNEEFFKMIEFWTDFQMVKLSLKGVAIDNFGNCTAQFNFLENEGKILNNPSDIFRLGLTLSNSETVRFRSNIGLALERMICMNRAMAPDKSYSIMCKHSKGSQRLMEDMWADTQKIVRSNISVQKFIEERIHRMIGVTASVRELEQTLVMLSKAVQNIEMVVPDLDTRIPAKKVTAAYGVDFSTKSEHWKSTASTPIEMYNLYNEVTWIGSNTGLGREAQEELEVKIGSMFLSDDKAPDMLDVAPIRTWN